MRRHGLLPALACLALLVSVQAASGHPPRRDSSSNPSHILLPRGISDRDEAEDVLAQRLRRFRDLSAVQDMLKKMGVNPEDFLKDDLAKDPKLRALAQKFAKDLNPNDRQLQKLMQLVKASGKLDEEQKETIRRVIPDVAGPEAPAPSDSKSPEKSPMDKSPMDQEKTSPKSQEGKPKQADDSSTTPDGTDSSDEKSPTSSAPSSQREERSGLLGEWLGSLRGESGLVGEMQNTLKGLFGPRTGLGNYTRGLTSDLRSRLPGLGDLRVGQFTRGLANLVPDALNFRPRDEDGASAGLADVATGLGSILLLGAVLGGAGVLLLVLVVRPRWGSWDRQDRWRLGPWPVQPSAVRTRGDVVQAFEYLALLLLGRKVSTSHHLDIAGQLGTSQNDPTGRRKNAAEELAQLYEHARYAPPSEQLSEDELATARHDLGFLAGGAAA